MSCGYQNILDQKRHTRKTDKIHKGSELFKSSCIIFCAKMLARRIDIFRSKVISKLSFRGIETFWT